MKTGTGFNPKEIIFAVTDKCNLHCKHCYVKRFNNDLNAKEAINFLKTCLNSEVNTIGFSGGEPFLNLNFIEEVCKYAVKNDFMFDRLMTNGDWWNNKEQLVDSLQKLYLSGFDGKIGLSWDSFHNQKTSRIEKFCREIYRIWNNYSMIEIQSVVNINKEEQKIFNKKIEELANKLNCKIIKKISLKSHCGIIILENNQIFIKINAIPQTFEYSNKLAWQSKKWFKEDFCNGPGQVLYIHPNGNIAPCCGFSNEDNNLLIGNIKQDFTSILTQAKQNKMVNICYISGLEKKKNELKKAKINFPGKTDDNCTFCKYICEHLSIQSVE